MNRILLSLIVFGFLTSCQSNYQHFENPKWSNFSSKNVQEYYQKKPMFVHYPRSSYTKKQDLFFIRSAEFAVSNFEMENEEEIYLCEVYEVQRKNAMFSSMSLGRYHDHIFYDRKNKFLGRYRVFVD